MPERDFRSEETDPNLVVPSVSASTSTFAADTDFWKRDCWNENLEIEIKVEKLDQDLNKRKQQVISFGENSVTVK